MDILRLWWLSLGIFAVVVVVVAVLLGLIAALAKSIDRHAEEIWIAGKQIAANTVSIWLLNQTLDKVSEILEDVRRMNGVASNMNDTLRALAQSGRGKG